MSMKLTHLRKDSFAFTTFCDEPVSPQTSWVTLLTAEPKQINCVRCLGEALVYHERMARDIEERMKALAGTIERCGVEGCRLPPDHRGRHAFGSNIP